MKKILLALKSYISVIISLLALVVAIITLFIANASLNVSKSSENISRQMLQLSSKDYDPVIQYDINDDSITIRNIFNDLFYIESIEIGKVEYYGYDDFRDHTTVQFPVIHSYWFFPEHILDLSTNGKGIYILNPQLSLCTSYDFRPFGEDKEKQIYNYFETYYHLDSKKGYALPSLQTAEYLMRISYVDMLGRHKDIYYSQYHCHGHGWVKDVINDSIYNNTLILARQETLDTINDIDSIMSYFKRKYAVNSDTFYGFY